MVFGAKLLQDVTVEAAPEEDLALVQAHGAIHLRRAASEAAGLHGVAGSPDWLPDQNTADGDFLVNNNNPLDLYDWAMQAKAEANEAATGAAEHEASAPEDWANSPDWVSDGHGEDHWAEEVASEHGHGEDHGGEPHSTEPHGAEPHGVEPHGQQPHHDFADDASHQPDHTAHDATRDASAHAHATPLDLGRTYWAEASDATWWPVILRARNTDGTYRAEVLDGYQTQWARVHASNVRLTLPDESGSGFADESKVVSTGGDPRVINGGLVSRTHPELTNFGHHAEDDDAAQSSTTASEGSDTAAHASESHGEPTESEQVHGDHDGSHIHSHDTIADANDGSHADVHAQEPVDSHAVHAEGGAETEHGDERRAEGAVHLDGTHDAAEDHREHAVEDAVAEEADAVRSHVEHH